ncbi:hypothetical protein HYR99_13720 [Candidatus Poribacteria bacterium]|nr:hypothetical protein [Candidatus Poribacteria bacterium]
MNYPFPGNVRELKNIIEHALIKSRGEAIQPEHLHFIAPSDHTQTTDSSSLIEEILEEGGGYSGAVDCFRQRLIMQVLSDCGGNRSEAARRLNMDRSNLIQAIRRLEIDK